MKYPDITTRHKIGALRREVAMRKRVYPRIVATKLMQQATADYEIEVMQAILDDYERSERFQAEMFDDAG
jgi:hypothetical protein